MMLRETDFGRLWAGRLVLAVVLSGLVFLPRPSGAVIIAAAAVLLGSLGWAGHAALMDHSAMSWLHCGSDALHLLAAGVWIGALAAFGMLLRGEGGAMATVPLSRFSGVGAASVAVLAATGVLNGWIILGGPDALLGATWGWLLIAKVGLFGAMLGLAAANRLWLTPRLLRAPDAEAVARLRKTILAEQGLALLVLGLVAVLGTLDPKG
jgi:putative copper resistance protein D